MPRAARRFWLLLAVLLLLAGAATGGALWLARSPDALRWAAGRIETALGGRLQLRGLSGSLARSFVVDRAIWAQGSVRVELSNLQIEWSLRALFSRAIDISSLAIDRVDVQVVPSGNPVELPASLAMPIAIRIGSADVGEVQVRVGQGAALLFHDVSLAYRGGRHAHRVANLSVISPWGPISGRLQLGTQRDFPVDGALAWNLENLPVDGQLNVAVAGKLERLELPVTGTLLAHAIAGQVRLRLFEAEKFEAIKARWSDVDLATLVEGAPPTALEVIAEAQSLPDALLAGSFEVQNATAGTLSADRLPLAGAKGRFRLAENVLGLSELSADLGSAGRARGDVRVSAEGTTLGLDVTGLNLGGLHEKFAATALDGRIDARLAGKSQQATVSLAQRNLTLSFEAARQGEEIEIARLAVSQRAGTLRGHGRVRLDGRRPFDADLRFNGIDPSAFVDFPSARLTGNTRLEGTLAPAWRVQGRFDLRNSRLRGLPLSANGAFSADARRVTTRGAELRLGGNTLHANGAFGAAGDSLAFRLDAPALAEVDPRLGGSLGAEGTVTGTVPRPTIELRFTGKEISVADYRATVIQGEGRFSQGRDPRLHLAASGEHFIVPALGDIAAAQVEIDGTRSKHTAKLGAASEIFDASAKLTGSYAGGRWTGQLTDLENRGRYPMRLEAPVALKVGPRELSIGAAHFVGGEGQVRIERIEFGEGRLETAGEFSGAPLAFMLALAGIDPGDTSLKLRGAWEIATTPRVNGTFHIERESGSVALGTEKPFPLRLSEVSVKGEIVEDRLSLKGRVVDDELGEARIAATALPVADARPPALGLDSAIEGSVEFTMPTLQALDRLAGLNASISGNARAAIAVAGTISDPVFTGKLVAEGVRIAAPQHALFLTDGRLDAELLEGEIRISDLSIAGGSGRLSATGHLALGDEDGESTIEWKASDFRLFSSPSRRMVLDGSGSLALRDRTLLARGDLRASQGHFVVTPTAGPRLGDDVVVVGREQPNGRRRNPLPLDVDVTFDFGDHFQILERGLDASLSGRLRLRTDAKGQLLAEGTVNVDRGSYLAYGQMLFIDDGRLYFNGPASNPGLKIRALRRNLPVQVGVSITGTALVPLVQLVSEPPMPDNEKLSWLILGRSPGSTSTADAAMLASAAEALMAGPSGVPLSTRMARQLGLDEFGLRSRGDEGEAVALGRRLSDNVYLFLERGITAATTVLIIEYTLTRELRLRAEAGDISGIGIAWGRTLD